VKSNEWGVTDDDVDRSFPAYAEEVIDHDRGRETFVGETSLRSDSAGCMNFNTLEGRHWRP